MKDLMGRPVEVGDIVLYGQSHGLELVRITRYSEQTQRVSVKPLPPRNKPDQATYGKSAPYSSRKLFLVRDLDYIIQ